MELDYFPVVLFIMLQRLSLRMKFYTMYIEGNAQHFPVVLFIMLNKVVLTFESVEILKLHDHSNESY